MLKILSRKEFKTFKLMVRSPYFNQQETIIRLIDFLEPAHPKFNKIRSPELMCQEVLGMDSEYGPREKELLKRLFFKTNQLVQQFMVLENFKTKPHLQQRLLMDSMRFRGNYDSLPGLLTKSRSNLKSDQVQEIDYLYHDFQFSEVDFFFQIYSNNRGKSSQMQALLDSFRRFAIGQSLHYYSAALNREQLLQVEYDYPLLPSVVHFLEEHPEDLETPFIHAWYCVIKLLQNPEVDQPFYTILQVLHQNRNQFSDSGLRQLYGFVLNHCSTRVLMGDLSYLEHSFNHYRHALEEGFLFVHKRLSPHHFIRMVKRSVEYGKSDWAEQFIVQHSDRLATTYKKEVIALAESMIYYSKNDFTKANEKLALLGKTEDVFYELDYKIQLLKIYYSFTINEKDTTYDDVLENLMESMRIYLLPQRRKTMAEHIRTGYTNFLNCFKQLRKRTKKQGEDRSLQSHKLKASIEQTSPLFEKVWLLKQIDD